MKRIVIVNLMILLAGQLMLTQVTYSGDLKYVNKMYLLTLATDTYSIDVLFKKKAMCFENWEYQKMLPYAISFLYGSSTYKVNYIPYIYIAPITK